MSEHPEYTGKLTESQKKRCIEDILYHMQYLSEAVSIDSPTLFLHYVEWVKILFTSLNVPNESFLRSLALLKEYLPDYEDPKTAETPIKLLQTAIDRFDSLNDTYSSFITPKNPHRLTAQRYLDLLLQGDRQKAATVVFDAVENGVPIKEIYIDVFQVCQQEIGRLWQLNKVSVAQEHFITAATQLIMSRLYPKIFSQKKNGFTFMGACVGDELHELGIRMISDFFELEGWDTYFLGANTPVEAIIGSLKRRRVHILGIGVTIAFHLDKAMEIITAIRNDPEITFTKIMVGGYPFNQDKELWRKIKADGYAEDAQEAISVAKQLVGMAS